MRVLILVAFLSIICKINFAQVSGNINYQNQIQYPESNIELEFQPNSNITITIKGLANVVADNFVAIFSVSQNGKSTEEVNTLLDNRINQALQNLKSIQGLQTFVDMISFVPVYEYESEKKIFSKKTYNEIPKGFELKKNIHIQYKNPNTLNEIIKSLSNSEIYDLVRVDYFSDKIESTKTELAIKAKIVLQEKLKTFKQIIGNKIDSCEKKLNDGYKIVYPVERYKAYQAYNSSDLNLKKSATVNQIEKSTTLYYQAIMNKEFDFVINPTVLEPVIQIMYEMKLDINQDKEIKPKSKEYFIITPSGDIKKFDAKN